MHQTLRGYVQPFWHNLEKQKVDKKVVVNKSRSLAAMFVSENGIKHFVWSKIHPMNTIKGHSNILSKNSGIDPTSVKLRYKTASGGHLVLPMWPKIFWLPLLSDLKDYAKFENNHRKQSGLRVSAS